jgi:hypothetical protein
MTIKLPSNVVQFAAGNISLYENYVDYWNNYQAEFMGKNVDYIKSLSFAEKEKNLNTMILREIGLAAGVDLTSQPVERFVNHPLVCWAAGNIMSQMIDAVLPQTMFDSMSLIADVRVAGYGESPIFRIKSRDLFRVTKAGRGMREAEMQKGFEKEVTLYPEPHMVTVGVSLFRVLSGQESLAEFTNKSLRSIESQFTLDVYKAFETSMASLSSDATTGLLASGWSSDTLTLLAQRVQAFSNGAKPVLLGTKRALAKVLPDDTNTRADYASDYVKVGYVRTINGVDTMEIPQLANWETPFSTYISDSYLWIVAPGTDKLVKAVLGGSTMANVTDPYSSPALFQNATFTKHWVTGVVTSSVAATISL